ncbi:hypothetical protein EZ428_04920 [Pedobacter frigiditerrae]|uniref:Lipoprotein n=1 Tax=Pedobacter frigiditerrae TaxID=2530452 RepID=A0A4R0N421_9SPHI|nr:hypothetical protein [Pedobacter frigiditerrae]TCC94123.1 hypothetical protein EZ428_04920 [Pedobacter frigiditerrae]
MKYLWLICFISTIISCKPKASQKSEAINSTPTKSPLIIEPTVKKVNYSIPDSVHNKIHRIIDNTEEYQSLKKQYKDKLALLVFHTEKQSTFEVSIGHDTFDRFSTSLRLLVNLNSKEIKVCDFEKGIITLPEYRRSRKI